MDKSSIFNKCNMHHQSLDKAWLEMVCVSPMAHLLDQYPLNTDSMRQKDDISFPNFNYSKQEKLPFVDVNPSDELSLEAELTQMAYDTSMPMDKCRQYISSAVDESQFFRIGATEVPLIISGVRVRFALIPRKKKSVRGLICSVPKRYVYDSKTKTVNAKEISIDRLLFAHAVFSSQTFLWLFNNPRRHNPKLWGPTRVMPPMPQPGDDELQNHTVMRELVRNSAMLTLSSNYDDFKEIAEKFKIEERFVPTDVAQIQMLLIRNNSLIADLYKLTPEELVFMKMNF